MKYWKGPKVQWHKVSYPTVKSTHLTAKYHIYNVHMLNWVGLELPLVMVIIG